MHNTLMLFFAMFLLKNGSTHLRTSYDVIQILVKSEFERPEPTHPAVELMHRAVNDF